MLSFRGGVGVKLDVQATGASVKRTIPTVDPAALAAIVAIMSHHGIQHHYQTLKRVLTIVTLITQKHWMSKWTVSCSLYLGVTGVQTVIVMMYRADLAHFYHSISLFFFW